ncbi:Atrial natriuretic peptide-converting enzyme [Plakobranchus ocellatus]|uniref:Atrial natriuretic peptide-converting enzyme n=1 Tax=Plakobranchus ocellatus TaxID=259542 RepID=A0AAV3YS62_9GAST|nr:Atrial natriuretic peptide-converting enzyme [Plakobranchus ocellatus]
MPNLIINGKDAQSNRYPWVVSMQHVGIHKCGGAIIHPYFVLTAAHCANQIYSMDLVRIVAGTVNLEEASIRANTIPNHVQIREVRRFIEYPGYTHFDGKDIALLELKAPLIYSRSVRQICLPEEDDFFSRTTKCHLAGWGHTSGTAEGQYVPKLQETKMSLVDTDLCNSSQMWDGIMAENEKCAGYFSGTIAACSGDSGSSLMCQDTKGFWKAVGVTSYVRINCSVPRYPMVYTDVLPYVEWIKNQTECVFTCDDGICLFDKEMICDSKDDCADRTDEIQMCPINTNCSFDDKFMCGYISTSSLEFQAAPSYVNTFPLYDHTLGRYPECVFTCDDGICLFDKEMICDSKDDCADRTDEIQMCPINTNCSFDDKFMCGYISTSSLEFQAAPSYVNTFPLYDHTLGRSHEHAKWSVDDVVLIEGKCEDMECLPGEFMCMTYGKKNCLPLAVQCNVAVDCDNAEDEKDCTDPKYICDFSNGNVCGIKQHTDDYMHSEWEMVNATRAANQMIDHTSGLASGNFLKIDTTRMLSVDQVLASMDVYLREQPHCLRFYYFSTSPFTFEIFLIINNDRQTLVAFTGRQTDFWTLTQAELPSVTNDQRATLTIVVTGGEMGSLLLSEVFMLDDISITTGNCPVFICPQGTLQCEDEAYCVPQDKVCDKKADCGKSTDEIFCSCTSSEYKCPNGPCISYNKTCDHSYDCPDKSDEGSICDSKRSVTCDFEDPFQCGYTVNTATPDFHWARVQGRASDPGPASDHTFSDDDTQLGFYALALSQFQGPKTVLTSTSFLSTGNGLVFYYHARHYLYEFSMTGRLSVVAKDVDTGVETKLWQVEPDNNDKWKMECVPLPSGHITVSFVAERGESSLSANIGLDDIKLLDITCDLYSTATNCSDQEYTSCRSGMCIKKSMLCDGLPDCPDGYDEVSCPPEN